MRYWPGGIWRSTVGSIIIIITVIIIIASVTIHSVASVALLLLLLLLLVTVEEDTLVAGHRYVTTLKVTTQMHILASRHLQE